MPGEAGKTQVEQGTVRIDRSKFAQALDKIVLEKDLGERLKQKPVETLAELGIECDSPEVAKTTAERMAGAIADRGKAGFVPAIVVEVGVEVAIGVVVHVAVHEEVDMGLEVERLTRDLDRAASSFQNVALKQSAETIERSKRRR
jgi:hypothetical protein